MTTTERAAIALNRRRTLARIIRAKYAATEKGPEIDLARLDREHGITAAERVNPDGTDWDQCYTKARVIEQPDDTPRCVACGSVEDLVPRWDGKSCCRECNWTCSPAEPDAAYAEYVQRRNDEDVETWAAWQ